VPPVVEGSIQTSERKRDFMTCNTNGELGTSHYRAGLAGGGRKLWGGVDGGGLGCSSFFWVGGNQGDSSKMEDPRVGLETQISVF